MATEQYEAISIAWPEQLGNNRAPAEFEQIINAMDVSGRIIYDLGCGHGDLIWALQQAGALVVGLDKDPALVEEVRSRGLRCILMDVEQFPDLLIDADVVICFSVLPYLKYPAGFLQRLHADVLLLECQYYGDGPGLPYLTDDIVMMEWLRKQGWDAHIIGRNFIEGRDKWRTIWYCQGLAT